MPVSGPSDEIDTSGVFNVTPQFNKVIRKEAAKLNDTLQVMVGAVMFIVRASGNAAGVSISSPGRLPPGLCPCAHEALNPEGPR